ncbi:MAG: glycosyltransferase family 2 protein [Gemmatimonadetes bacterium]|jgi:GT2 family glycosyltransferase|nr:glycosyltransferase family 2 protein [Gemmatimonadota bacterium]MBT6146928.1 glycosyltransferase family 2 protein [Gemmatimonadota bacterium]MBT7862983.1 glycosyltransferase family 2 protein [Gemmatimonadota bacterium]
MRLTVIIPHFRSPTLDACLRSLEEHTDEDTPIHVIVVDDGDGADSLRSARAGHPQIQVLENAERLGFTGSCNAGLAATTTPYALLLNDDTEVTPGWLPPLLHAMDEDPSVAVCQPKLRSASRPEFFDYSGAAGGYIDSLGFTFCRGRVFDTVEKDEGQYDHPVPLFWACGSAMILRMEAVHQVGTLDLDYFMHFEEIDLCWRLRLAGWRVLAVPTSTVYHHAAQSLPPNTFLKVYLNHRNNLVALLKNLPLSRLMWLLPVRIGLDWVASVAYLAKRQWRSTLAPISAHAWILTHPLNIWRRRRTSRRLVADGPQSQEGIFTGSALWRYHMSRHRLSSDLIQETS